MSSVCIEIFKNIEYANHEIPSLCQKEQTGWTWWTYQRSMISIGILFPIITLECPLYSWQFWNNSCLNYRNTSNHFINGNVKIWKGMNSYYTMDHRMPMETCTPVMQWIRFYKTKDCYILRIFFIEPNLVFSTDFKRYYSSI